MEDAAMYVCERSRMAYNHVYTCLYLHVYTQNNCLYCPLLRLNNWIVITLFITDKRHICLFKRPVHVQLTIHSLIFSTAYEYFIASKPVTLLLLLWSIDASHQRIRLLIHVVTGVSTCNSHYSLHNSYKRKAIVFLSLSHSMYFCHRLPWKLMEWNGYIFHRETWRIPQHRQD